MDLKVFFTGSGRVGRIVAGAAAKTLTPVTLEVKLSIRWFACHRTTNTSLLAWRKVSHHHRLSTVYFCQSLSPGDRGQAYSLGKAGECRSDMCCPGLHIHL